MDITIHKESLRGYDTGGGTREVSAFISVESDYPERLQRKVVIYETLGACLDYVLSHEKLEDLADTLVDALDQLEEANLSEALQSIPEHA